jgi:protein-tyrosine phosphatase
MSESLHLLFVCSGNICRSPMAEGFARAQAQARGWPVQVASAGTLGIEDRAADPLAVKVMGEKAIDISAHRSQGLREELIAQARHILVMEMHHQMELHRRYPQSEGKVLMLGSFGGLAELADPIGGWRWRFRSSRDDIERCVERFMDSLPPPSRW